MHHMHGCANGLSCVKYYAGTLLKTHASWPT